MKSVSPQAVVATLALHAALIAVVAFELPGSTKPNTAPTPIAVQVVATQAPVERAPALQEPSRTTASSPREPKRAQAKPRTTTKPVPSAPQARPAPIRTPAADVDTEAPSLTAPAASAAASPPSTAAASPAPAASAPPARTAVSVADHAAGNRRPPYPRLSQQNNEEGTVILRVLVKADGTAGAVEIKTSSGYPLLDKSARATVQTWRFKPATINGKPVDEWYEQPIPFKLQED